MDFILNDGLYDNIDDDVNPINDVSNTTNTTNTVDNSKIKINPYNYLNYYQKKFLKKRDYKLIDNLDRVYEDDYICMMDKHGLRFYYGGKITDVTPSFVRIKARRYTKIIYPQQYYIFYAKNMKKKENQLHYLLEGLTNGTIKLYKKQKTTTPK